MKTESSSNAIAGQLHAGLAAIFLFAGAGLAYEITLTRVFSVILQYQSVFLVVSVSILGLGAGAALATLRRRDSARTNEWADLTAAAGATALLLVGAAVTIAWVRSAEGTIIAFVAAMLPFAGIGFVNARLFAAFARSGGTLYAADLLGATVGLLLAFAAIGWIGGFDLILALAVLAGVGTVVLARLSTSRTLRARSLVFAGVLALGFVLNRGAGLIEFSPGAIANAPPDKTLIHLMQAGEVAVLETRWDPFARLDMATFGDDSIRYVFTDAGAGSLMIRYDGSDDEIGWMRREIEYLPFATAPNADRSVLIIGAGAGRDVLMAKLAGAGSITAVEINPALVDLTRDTADYNGGVLDLPGVQTVIADGRNFVERTDQAYDLIYGNVVYSQAAAPGHSALSESYVFTREALHAYWAHLTDTGEITFVTHQGVEGIRLLVAALDMLQGEGMTIQEALDRVALATRRSGDVQSRTSLVTVRRQAWTPEETRAYVEAARAMDVGLLYLPGFQEIGMEGLATGAVTLEGYIAANADLFDYSPTTDDSPFFYQLVPGLPAGLSDLLLVSLIAAFVYLSWAIFFFVRSDGMHWKRAVLTPFFALLGAAYLLVEIPLIQRFSLLLGQPSLALIIVIGSMLLGSGLGSLFSSRFALTALPRRITLIGALVAVVVALTLPVYSALIGWALPFGLEVRVAVTVIAILPLGFVMGMPFPSGLRVAHEADARGIAAFWGANAVTSVVGSVLAMALAVEIGFSAALLAGAALYAATAGLVRLTWHRVLA